MSNLTIQPGFVIDGLGANAAAILTMLAKSAAAGQGKPISLKVLGRQLGLEDHALHTVLKSLVDRDLISHPGMPWPEIQSIKLARPPQFVIEATGGRVAQKALDYVEDQGEIPGVPAKSREDLGTETFTADHGTNYTATVCPVHQSDGSDGLLYVDLKITAIDVDDVAGEPITKVQMQTTTIHEAWAFWDEYKTGLEDGEVGGETTDTVLDWIEELARCSTDGGVVIDGKSMDALLTALAFKGTDAAVLKQARKRGSFLITFDEESGNVSCLVKVNELGATWPGLEVDETTSETAGE